MGLVIIGETVAEGTMTSLGVCDGIADTVGAWDVVGTKDVASISRIAPSGLTNDGAMSTTREGIACGYSRMRWDGSDVE
jgi:hypothetical protein